MTTSNEKEQYIVLMKQNHLAIKQEMRKIDSAVIRKRVGKYGKKVKLLQ
jgi:hypothetical protein